MFKVGDKVRVLEDLYYWYEMVAKKDDILEIPQIGDYNNNIAKTGLIALEYGTGFFSTYSFKLLEDESILEEKPATAQELADHVTEVETAGHFEVGHLVIALQTIPGNEIVKDTLYQVKAVDSHGYLCITIAQLDAMVGVPPEYFESYSEAAEAIEDESEFQGIMEIVSKSVEKATAGVVEKAASERQTGDPRSYNVGSSNYADFSIQPWDIWREYDLNPWDADIIKRTLRTKKGEERVLDYEKIIHICKERIRQIND